MATDRNEPSKCVEGGAFGVWRNHPIIVVVFLDDPWGGQPLVAKKAAGWKKANASKPLMTGRHGGCWTKG